MIILDDIKDVICGEYKIIYNDKNYNSFEEVKAAAQRPGRVVLKCIECVDGIVNIALIDNPIMENAVDSDWAEIYKKEFGTEPSFF